jgi:transposase
MIRLMKALTISDPQNMILALQDEIRRNDTSRYDHRLHGVLLVAQGMTCPHVAEVLGDSPRTVVNWVQRFEAQGLAGLSEGERPGRPSRLNEAQLTRVEAALRSSPTQFGLPTAMWDGPTLSAFLGRQPGVKLKVRQCQRLFRQLGFRLRKPRPKVAQADPQLQTAHKKTPPPGSQSRSRSVGNG